jgi:Flp pilus assembly protein TadG
MIAFMKKLWRDRRGNALVIAGAALPMLVGAAGLATDTVQWALWKRELQRAADSAAYAGVYAKALGDNASNAVTADLVRNNQTGIALKSGYPQVAFPANTSTFTNAVQVSLGIQKRLGFSSLFLSVAPTITTTATAAMIDVGNYCLVGLKKSGGPAISISGNSTANMGCDSISNSKNNPSFYANGTNYSFVSPNVAGVGTLPTAITGVTKLKPHALALKDPFEGKYSTDIPAGMTCQTFAQHRYNVGTGLSAVKHLTPGCYNAFAPNGADTYYMDPGVYYLDSTNFALNGNDTLIGTGVTIILTGTTPGNIQINGTATVQLKAPVADDPTTTSVNETTCGSFGTPAVDSCAYKQMLSIQSANAAADNVNTIDGTSTSFFDGAFYFPKGNVTFTGTSGATTKCAMVVAYTVVFSGNTNLQNNTTGCSANITVPGKAIRLIA